MITTQNQKTTRKAWAFTLNDGEQRTLYPDCDYFYVFSILDAGQIARNGQLSLNNDDFGAVSAGHSNQGLPGAGDIKRLTYKNDSGVAVTVVVIYGNGRSNFLGAVKLQGGVIDLSSGTITSLANAINAATILNPYFDAVAAAGAAGGKVYSGFKSIEIYSKDVGKTIHITTASGSLNFDLTGGVSKEWSCENDQSHFEDITVRSGVGEGAFEVTGTKV